MKRRLLISLMSLVFVLGAFGLAACGNNEPNAPSGDDPPDVPPAKTYTVVFDANGGVFEKGEIDIGDGETIDDGAEISSDGKTATYTVSTEILSEPLRMPELDRSAFCGWAKDKDGEALWDFEHEEALTESVTTLYAVWAVSFDFARSEDGSYYIVRGIGGLSGDVEIPETHNRKPVKEIARDAFKNCRTLTGIVIPDSVTAIGTSAFKSATKLESVTIGEGVTEIGDSVFAGCNALAVLGLPKSLKEISYSAFSDEGNKSIVEVRYAGTAGEWCGIGMDCSIETSPANPLANGKAELFINGRAANNITVDAEKINPYAFYRCNTIESVTVGSGVKTIGEKAFYRSSLKTLDFEHDSALASIGADAFESAKIKTLTLPSSVGAIGARAFKSCTQLTALKLGGAKTLGEEAFSDCRIESINLGTVEYIGKSAFLTEDGTVSSITIPDSVWYIGSGCFGGWTALNGVTFESNSSSASWNVWLPRANPGDEPETVASAALSTPSAAADKLKGSGQWMRIAGTLTISGDTVTGVTNKNGKGMLAVPKSHGGMNVTKIAANAFSNFKGLRYLSIEANVTEIGDGFINGCDNLGTVSVAGNNAAYASTGAILYKKQGSILWINRSVKSTRFLTIPNGVKIIPNGMFTDMDIYDLKIPATVTEVADGAFSGCAIEQAEIPACAAKQVANDKLKSVDIISGKEIPADAFKGCKSLRYAWMPDGLTAIGAGAFSGCVGLESFEVPPRVTSIGAGAFDGCAIVLETAAKQSECSWSYDGLPVVYDSRNNKVASDGFIYTTVDGMRYMLKDGEATVAKQRPDLSKVKIPESITFGKDADGKDAVYEVSGIADGAFDGCAVEAITVASGNKHISVYKGILYNAEKTRILLIPSGVKGNVQLADTLEVIPENAFAGFANITKITIPGSVKSIGENAFDGCESLSTVNYTGDIASWCGIAGLENLTASEISLLVNGQKLSGELVVPDGVTAIPARAFNNCGPFTSVTLPKSIASIGSEAFKGCSIDRISYNGDVAGWCGISGHGNIMSIGRSLYINGQELSGELVVPDGVTGIGDSAFLDCDITSVTIGKDVTSIGSRAFYNCNSLESFTVAQSNAVYASRDGILYDKAETYVVALPKAPKGDVTIPDGVTEIAFVDRESLTGVTIPKSVERLAFSGNMPALAKISVAADNAVYASQDNVLYDKAKTKILWVAKALNGSVNIPNGVTAIQEAAFENCKGLTSVTISSGVASIGSRAFYRCDSLAVVTIPNGVKSNGSLAFGYCASLVNATVSDGIESMVSDAFHGCEKLRYNENGDAYYLGNDTNKYVVLTEVKDESATSCTVHAKTKVIAYNAFKDCDELARVNFDGSVTECCGIATVENLMRKGKADKKLYIGGKMLSGALVVPNDVTAIPSYAFNGCDAITSVTVPSSVTEIGCGAFGGCNAITTMTLPFVGGNARGQIVNGSMISGCANIGYIFGDSRSGNNGKVVPESLKTVTVTGGTSVGYQAFAYCSNIESVTLPDGVTSIGEAAFNYCRSLKSVRIGDGVEKIGRNAFGGCGALTTIRIGSGLKEIEYDAFGDCSSLETIIFDGTKQEWKEIKKAVIGIDDGAGDYVVQCSDGKLNRRGSELD